MKPNSYLSRVARAAPLAVLDQASEWRSFAPGLARISDVLERLGHPQRGFRHLLVGGTNGKGTVASNIAAHGPGKTGLFTSPHLQDIRERITINGEWLPDEAWREAYHHITQQVADPRLSYFEWLTVLACVLFAREGVDLAVFEVGLGGRLDAVNALDPEISVLTGVALDHTEILGDTIEKIALEKIEIARKGRPLVLPRTLLAIPAVARRIKEIACQPVQLAGGRGYEDARETVTVSLGLLNLGNDLSHWRLPAGRRERVPAYRDLYLDGAHNSEAWRELCRWIKGLGFERINMICSLSQGRDPRQFLSDVSPILNKAYLWRSGFEKELDDADWPSDVIRVSDEGLSKLLAEPVLVTGSLYLVGAFKSWLEMEG